MIFKEDIESTLIGEHVSIAKTIGYTSKIIHAALNQAFHEAKLDLQVETYILLKVLHLKKNVIQQDMAKAMQKDKSSILRIINNLQDKKWVARIPDSTDKRRNYLVLTQLGTEILDAAGEAEEKVKLQLTQDLTENDLSHLKSVLFKIRTNLYPTLEKIC